MSRLFHALILGLCGAVIVHVVILLLIPAYSERDAWSAIEARSGLYEATRIDAAGDRQALIGSVDPLFDAVACRFDLREGILRVVAPGEVPFWSASIFGRAGYNVFSFNDRTALGGQLDFVVATPVQMIELRNDMPPALEGSVFVEADIGEGIAVIRSFVPDPTWEPLISRYLAAIECRLL